MFELEQKLMESYDHDVIHEMLIRLEGKHIIKPLVHINNCWDLPIPLQSVIMSLPRGFLQDYSYVLLAKSRELVAAKNFDCAIELLKVLDKELEDTMKSGGSAIFKLSKLVNWECLLVEIWKCFYAWPATNICTYIKIKKNSKFIQLFRYTKQVLFQVIDRVWLRGVNSASVRCKRPIS